MVGRGIVLHFGKDRKQRGQIFYIFFGSKRLYLATHENRGQLNPVSMAIDLWSTLQRTGVINLIWPLELKCSSLLLITKTLGLRGSYHRSKYTLLMSLSRMQEAGHVCKGAKGLDGVPDPDFSNSRISGRNRTPDGNEACDWKSLEHPGADSKNTMAQGTRANESAWGTIVRRCRTWSGQTGLSCILDVTISRGILDLSFVERSRSGRFVWAESIVKLKNAKTNRKKNS